MWGLGGLQSLLRGGQEGVLCCPMLGLNVGAGWSCRAASARLLCLLDGKVFHPLGGYWWLGLDEPLRLDKNMGYAPLPLNGPGRAASSLFLGPSSSPRTPSNSSRCCVYAILQFVVLDKLGCERHAAMTVFGLKTIDNN